MTVARLFSANAMRAYQKLRVALRRSVGVLPDFLIIGAQRAGTTALFSYLCEHPAFFAPARKEIHFFSYHYHAGMRWYRQLFPTFRTKYAHLSSGFATGEASPYYLFHPLAAERVRAALPKVKLVVLLRNPIDRAFSKYHYNVKTGRETLSFEDAIAQEEARLSGEREKIVADPTYRGFNHQFYSYLTLCIYVDQLQQWMQHFPREQFIILNSEDFFADTDRHFRAVLRHVGLPEISLPSYSKVNAATKSQMSEATRKSLADFFRPHNARLFEFLGVDWEWD